METVLLPEWDAGTSNPERVQELLTQLASWIVSEPLLELATAWGDTPDLTTSPELIFEWFDDFSSKNWDFRTGRERDLASAPDFARHQEELTIAVAKSLGLIGARAPKYRRYDYTLVLGGLIRACVTRSRYAQELASGGIDLGNVYSLGGFRAFSEQESLLSKALNVEAHNEFDALVVGARMAFELPEFDSLLTSNPPGRGNADWAIATFTSAKTSVIAAPSRDPESRRANTADTYNWWANRIGEIRSKRILLITSPIYVPYQGATAIQNLGIPFDVSVETVGTSKFAEDLGEHTQQFTVSNYLQEIRSTIRGYYSLYKYLLEMSTMPYLKPTSGI